jgi:Fe-S oxidoreductase
LPEGASSAVVLHGHCQQKTLGWMPAAVELLSSIPGVDLRVTSSECCGMAGSFGYKTDYYPLSAELGRRLVTELDALGEDGNAGASGVDQGCRILACGTSCRSQIVDLGKRRACHPVQLIDERLDNL